MFWSKVEKTDTCWNWKGSVTPRGYGKFGIKAHLVHRFSYIDKVGEIPEGYVVDHICFNKLCVNPDHLEAVTQKENVHRAQIKYQIGIAKTHCPKGHAYTEENTTVRNNNRRHCKACARQWSARTKLRNKEIK